MKIYVVMERNNETNDVSPISATFREPAARIIVRELNLNEMVNGTPGYYMRHYFYESVDLLDKECLMEFKQ
jgi:hypothetical protein